MSDVLTAEQRHRCMTRIRGKDTDPERQVRSMIHTMGFRYRLHVSGLPGKPDIVLPRLRKVVLVHGCFWHMHRCKFGRVQPATNANFWKVKREGNRRRDATVLRALQNAGWDVLTVWECELRDSDLLSDKIKRFLAKEKQK
ncbi:MAG: DNA mismatch endonuclease Vsr [Lentisphaerae bacterium]|nr:DNA mismatch endonuclease Vsr [Lentisphaerota bacterium]